MAEALPDGSADDAEDDRARGVDENSGNFSRNAPRHAFDQFGNPVGKPCAVAVEEKDDEGDERELNKAVADVDGGIDDPA